MPFEPFFAQPKPEKLVHRAPCTWVIVARDADGRRVEIRLGPVRFDCGVIGR